MDRDQRSRRQKSGTGSFSRAPQKRSMASRMGLEKQDQTRADTRRRAAAPPRQSAQQSQSAARRQAAPRRPVQVNPQKAGYRSDAARPVRRVTQAEQLRRRRSRRLLGLLVVAGALVVGILLSVNLLFKVTAFRVETFDRETPADTGIYTEEQIVDLLGVQEGDNLFSFSAKAKTAELQAALPYLDRVQVDVQLPGTVVVKVEPATERFALQYSGGWLILSDGLKILRTESDRPDGFVLLRANLAQDFAPAVGRTVSLAQNAAETATGESAQTAAGVLDQILASAREENQFDGQPAPLFDGLTVIDVRDLSDLTLTYEDRVTVLLGSTANLEYKLRLAAKILLDPDKGLSASDYGTLDISAQQSDSEYRAYFQPAEAAAEAEDTESAEDTEGAEAAAE